MKEGGFNLHKWMSNSAKLMEQINLEEGPNVPYPRLSEDEPYASSGLVPAAAVPMAKGKDENKLLGVIWNTKRDTLVTRLNTLHEKACGLPVTKRGVLQIAPSIYDPLGLVSPVVITVKILFQTLCVDKSWDETLEDAKTRWSRWIADL